MMRALRVVRAQLRASLAIALQYRFEFAVEGALALLWIAVTLAPLLVVFGTRREVAIRKGTLDFVLLKPADAQLLVSLSKIEPWRLIDLLAAGGIFAIAFQRIGRPPGLTHALLALVLLCGAVLVLYSIAILVVSIAFIAVRVDNLLYLFQSIFDVARWPSTIFRGVLSLIFTFVLPLALMTTYPALALLGKLTAGTAAGALLGTLLFAGAARAIWLASIRRYTSASS